MKNRPFHTTDPVDTTLFDKTVEGFSNEEYGKTWYSVNPGEFPVLYAGQDYTVIWDGTEYNLTCYELDGNYLLGNAAIWDNWGDDTGEPFLIDYYDKSWTRFLSNTTDTSHTVKITTVQSEVIELDEKYISYKPGLNVEGKIFSVYNPETQGYEDVAASKGAEIFNDYANNVATGEFSHAEGSRTNATAYISHAEGCSTSAFGDYSHSEGYYTTATGPYSHVEGRDTSADGAASHAEGQNTTANGDWSHAEGYMTGASGVDSHAEGWSTSASGAGSHAEGCQTKAAGGYSHAEGLKTTASSNHQHVQGKYNVEDTSYTYAHIVGNGTDTFKRSNAHTLDWNGNAEFQGDVKANACGGENPMSLVALAEKVNDCKPFIITVTVSADPSVTECTMDKTFAEIEEAYNNGKNIYVMDTANYWLSNLCGYDEGYTFSFASSNFSGGSYWLQAFQIDSDGSVTRRWESIALGTSKLTTNAFTVTGAINEVNSKTAMFIICTQSGDTYSLDKTFAEIEQHIKNGGAAMVFINGRILQLAVSYSEYIEFSNTYIRSNEVTIYADIVKPGVLQERLFIFSDNSVEFLEQNFILETTEIGTLETDDKTIVGAINEVNAKASRVNDQYQENQFVLTDKKNGFKYIIEIHNGQIVSYCSLESIEIKTLPTKLDYSSGDTFDPTGMEVIGIAYDGTERPIEDYNYTETVNSSSVNITYIENGIEFTTSVEVTLS